MTTGHSTKLVKFMAPCSRFSITVSHCKGAEIRLDYFNLYTLTHDFNRFTPTIILKLGN